MVETILANLVEELFVALIPSEQACNQHQGPVDCKQRPDAIEFGGEDLEYHKGKGELPQRRAHISSLECSLRSTHFHQLVLGQYYRPRSSVLGSMVLRGVLPLADPCQPCQLLGYGVDFTTSNIVEGLGLCLARVVQDNEDLARDNKCCPRGAQMFDIASGRMGVTSISCHRPLRA